MPGRLPKFPTFEAQVGCLSFWTDNPDYGGDEPFGVAMGHAIDQFSREELGVLIAVLQEAREQMPVGPPRDYKVHTYRKYGSTPSKDATGLVDPQELAKVKRGYPPTIMEASPSIVHAVLRRLDGRSAEDIAEGSAEKVHVISDENLAELYAAKAKLDQVEAVVSSSA